MRREPRIDALGLPTHWPRLFEGSPDEREFVRRDAEITAKLHPGDFEQLGFLSHRFGITTGGVVLSSLFAAMYGRYLLVSMRREHTGLFGGCLGEDPAGHDLVVDGNSTIVIPVPRRMFNDLKAIAEDQAVPVASLTAAIIHAYLMGHIGTAPIAYG